MDVTVQTLASNGYAETSLAKIATNAGVSKGVISYHFAGKGALVESVMTRVYGGITERMLPQLEGLEPLAMLRAHVLAVARDIITHPDEIAAVREIALHHRSPDGGLRFGVHTNEPLYAGLEALYLNGQRSGAMRDFDVRTMAVLAQSALDSMFEYCRLHPERDVMAHAASLADLLIHAVAAPDHVPPTPTLSNQEDA